MCPHIGKMLAHLLVIGVVEHNLERTIIWRKARKTEQWSVRASMIHSTLLSFYRDAHFSARVEGLLNLFPPESFVTFDAKP